MCVRCFIEAISWTALSGKTSNFLDADAYPEAKSERVGDLRACPAVNFEREGYVSKRIDLRTLEESPQKYQDRERDHPASAAGR